MSLGDLIKYHRFIGHPFDSWIAEGEDKLQEWFVAPYFFDAFLGIDKLRASQLRPRSHVVFGVPGAGKTALRARLEKELLHRTRKSLVLRYIDFANPLQASKRPDLSVHVEEILRLGTIALIGFWQRFPSGYGKLDLRQKSELAGLAYRYYESLPPETKRQYMYKLSPVPGVISAITKKGVHALVDAYNATVSILKKERIEPTNWGASEQANEEQLNPHLRCERFWHLAKSFGVESIWVLVDCVDESPGGSRGEAIFDTVASLLLSQRVLEFRDGEEQVICFKFFLSRPDYVIPLMNDHGFRKDRVKLETLDWKSSDLEMALQKRLAYFSNGHILHFDDFCDETAKGAHRKLLEECKGRPRTLFRMAHETFAEFARRDIPGVAFLDRQAVEVGCKEGLSSVVG